MAKDLYHDLVRNALVTDGWTITHDPLTLPGVGVHPFQIDLGAERMMGAEKAGEKIAVEIKSFIGKSISADLHEAFGQYINYFMSLKTNDPERVLFLAVPEHVYNVYFDMHHVLMVTRHFNIKIFTYDISDQKIGKWIN